MKSALSKNPDCDWVKAFGVSCKAINLIVEIVKRQISEDKNWQGWWDLINPQIKF